MCSTPLDTTEHQFMRAVVRHQAIMRHGIGKFLFFSPISRYALYSNRFYLPFVSTCARIRDTFNWVGRMALRCDIKFISMYAEVNVWTRIYDFSIARCHAKCLFPPRILNSSPPSHLIHSFYCTRAHINSNANTSLRLACVRTNAHCRATVVKSLECPRA